jgi:hypothetical protein
MASTSDMSLPTFRPTLAHSYNSRGELGMFVNPYACSCITCEDYKSNRAAPAPSPSPTPTPISLTTLPPPPTIQEVAAAEGLVSLYRSAMFSPPPNALQRTITGFHYSPSEDDEIGPTSSVSVTGLLPSLATAAAAPSRPLGGLGLASSTHGAIRFWTEEEQPTLAQVMATPETSQESNLIASLKSLRLKYLSQQEAVYEEDYRSHDEMAAADAIWESLDNKIHAIQELLTAFGETFEEA